MRILDVGARAPELAFHPTPHRRPRVLAFVREWTPPRDAGIEEVRAQLRGLGAELAVLSVHGAWSFRPDDSAEPIDGAGDREAIAKCDGVHRDRDAVFVIGADSVIRFADVPETPLAGSLATALAAAVDAMHARRTPPIMFTRRE